MPQHALQLDGTLVCVNLYGAYGPETETRFTSKLQGSSRAGRILEVLVWLGSPASLQQVGEVLSTSLLKVRSLMFYRLSDEVLSDVEVTNSLINGLGYREHQKKAYDARIAECL